MSYLVKNYNRKKISFKRGKGAYLYSTQGSKSFSIINDLNLLLRLFLDLIFLSITEFSKLSFEVADLVFIFADKFNRCAFP